VILVVASLDEGNVVELNFGVLANDDSPPSPEKIVQQHSQGKPAYQVLNFLFEAFLLSKRLEMGSEVRVT
jgi:hypothetical protein